MNGKLSGRKAIITGGSSGIGKACAHLFAQEGAAVSIIGRSEEKGAALVKDMICEGYKAVYVQADVSRDEDCRLAVEKTVDALGGVDILINNAGIVLLGGVKELTEEAWDRTMAVNVKSIFLMSKYTVPHLAESVYGGVIVNMGSALSHAGSRTMIAYAASKAAVLSMTKSMALDLCRQFIRVVCVCPGDTESPGLVDEARQSGVAYEAYLAASMARRPLGMVGSPEDIARGVLYLASDDARYITGTSLVIDGGGLAAYGMGT